MKRIHATYADLKPGDLFLFPAKPDHAYQKLFGGWYLRCASAHLAYPNPKLRVGSKTPVVKLERSV